MVLEQNWKGVDFHPNNSIAWRSVHECLQRTNWRELCSYASTLNHSIPCSVLPSITYGLHHMVRLLGFDNGTRWVVRIQLARSTRKSAKVLQSEVDVMTLISSRTDIPVPMVFGYEANDNNSAGVAFMLLEFLPGNVATDADGGYAVHHGQIPLHHRQSFYSSVSQIQVQMTSVRLPKIGTIVRREDGSYDSAPFPEIGGPFETATAFFKAWAAHAQFPMSTDKIQEIMNGGPVNEVLDSIRSFPSQIEELASRLSSCEHGPFPVVHRDFFHSNIVIDQAYKILGIIDWEGACTLPWELVEFPLFLETVPAPMDAPCNYDEGGEPIDEDTRRKLQERNEYVDMVVRSERTVGSDNKLSSALENQIYQNIAYAMRVYVNPGKLGLYSKVIDQIQRT